MYNSIELLKKLEYSKTLEAFELFYFPAEITLERHRASTERHRASILKNNSWLLHVKSQKNTSKVSGFSPKNRSATAPQFSKITLGPSCQKSKNHE
jgi:hypothetical protein